MPAKKIVIADDDESIRKTFDLILNKKYQIFPAKDSREALALFKGTKFDLLIADCKLPYLSGLELVEELRKRGYRGEVILISAFPDLVKGTDLDRLSIGQFFVKPLDLKVFTKLIDWLLESTDQPEKGMRL